MSLIFSIWRSLWCLCITILSSINIISQSYSNTSRLLLSVIWFMLFDMLFILFNKNLFNGQIIIHHIVAIILIICGIYMIIYTDTPHYNVINMCLTTEIVTSIHIINCMASKYKNIICFRLYRILYILLTVIWRGSIWYSIISYAIYNINSNIFCIIGTLPFIIFDTLWIRDCIYSLYRTKLQ